MSLSKVWKSQVRDWGMLSKAEGVRRWHRAAGKVTGHV